MEHTSVLNAAVRTQRSGAGLDTERTVTLAETLRRTLETRIVAGELEPGTRLDEVELAESFGVSRTPVREALRSLAAGGLVEMRSRQGAVVSTITVAMLIEMFQVMAEMEGLCARLAARRATPSHRRAMQESHDRLIEALRQGDPVTFYDVNREFHEVIYDASQAEFVAEQTRSLRNRVAPYRRYVTFQPGRMAATIGEHERILNAIKAADADEAQRAMRDHVNLLGDNLTDFIAALPRTMLRAR